MSNIRNFCIIAHIDHGKSTLADRLLELTGTIEKRKMQEQFLDQMELERERGITIKLQPVRMKYQEYILNLIDTPGHVDFTYEVSRSLAAVEGAILLVDATKGVQAQTIANLHLAQQQRLVIIPVINKIDMPTARTKEVEEEIFNLLGVTPEEILKISAKSGEGVAAILKEVVRRVPPPKPPVDTNFRALIFDSVFDAYKGVIAYVRVFSGSLRAPQSLKLFAAKEKVEVIETGYFMPRLQKNSQLEAGEIGYIATGVKIPGKVRVGDTIGDANLNEALAGYQEPRSVVFASFYPEDSEQFDELKDALEKLKLTDASLSFEPESSPALGRGFRLGFLGMLHIEIISERLKREFGLELIISSPTVEYEIYLSAKGGSASGGKNTKIIKIRSASQLPDPSTMEKIQEPMSQLNIITPQSYLGAVMTLVGEYRNEYKLTEYLSKEVVRLVYEIPLAEIITDFYDRLKSVSSGYASMSYEPIGYRQADLIRLDILVAGDPVEPFSKIVPRDQAESVGRAMVAKLKEVVPPQLFTVALQAAIGGKIIARESITAKRKDVTGYLYGGDITRKKKLLEKQKRGKERMKEEGKVNIPQKVFLEMLKK
ncbi:MAG: translation elongation factor 4 [bacterium]|nr:translation elongation factor 4 [bacterium]